METLDQEYLNDLVERAIQGSSNAFAELFAASGQRQYAYAMFMLGEEESALKALRGTFAMALRGLGSLRDPALFMPWISRICFRYCEEMRRSDSEMAEDEISLSRILQLPLTESQIILMRYRQGMSERKTGDILNLNKGALRRYEKAGLRHLRMEQGMPLKKVPRGKSGAQVRLRAPDAAATLAAVFEECGRKPNSVPMEALSSYAIYRRERFSLQKAVLRGALVLFLLMPLLFILPGFEVTSVPKGERGLPVYTVSVRSLLPVGKVTAMLKTHALPVYEAAAREFTVEPTRNGTLTIYVELINRQGIRKTAEVSEVDSEGPELTDSKVETETVTLLVRDAGIGINYREIYAVSKSGEYHEPLRIDTETGEVTFAYPEENWDVYIPDYIGNTLHLALSFQ